MPHFSGIELCCEIQKIKKLNGIHRIIHAAHLKKDRDIDADEKIYIINIYKNTYNRKMTSICCVLSAWFTLQA